VGRLHDCKCPQSDFRGNAPYRFCAVYRKVGGEIAVEYTDAER
jgi:acetyl esterase